MDAQTKLENVYDQNTLKFQDSTGARHLEKGGENCVQNDKFIVFFLKIWEMIQNDFRWVQGCSESFPDHQKSIKKVLIWRTDNVPKTRPRSHMNAQNHFKIQKYPVLAHNIHKDCPLGVVKGFSEDIWCESLSFIICSEGPGGENQGFNATVC